MMATNTKAALFTSVILTLALVVGGAGTAHAAMPELDDEQKALCDKKVEREIGDLHKRFDEERAKSVVFASDKVVPQLEGNTPQYFGTAFEGVFDSNCDLERFDGRMNLILNTYSEGGKLYNDVLDVKFDVGGLCCQECTKEEGSRPEECGTTHV